jgi:disulfide bond formation protein DsbB
MGSEGKLPCIQSLYIRIFLVYIMTQAVTLRLIERLDDSE